ncbi:hypothetical protein Nepgr_012011 [Nepenthes gracilis]|uniref:RING-type E3 ubiquitin transferase n=1 Tax=Nepenthes gracilis TaxID=150966 RepID=A0AAD3XMY0_NEPGR|nr:hypothetical protein Nepgr_012011 [Nepenthes gracilis]
MASSGSTYWCYRCDRFVTSHSQHIVICPDCGSGFFEEFDDDLYPSPLSPRRLLRASAASFIADDGRNANLGLRGSSRNAGDRSSPFNPVIVLRGAAADGGGGTSDGNGLDRRNYQLYYDEGAGLGLRPLPLSVSEVLMRSGFDRLIDRLSQLETNGLFRSSDHPPASKSAVESLPVVRIVASHIVTETHCAVCKESFSLDTEARELPCKHIYHSECILPWLLLRNSCPVCRFELPKDLNDGERRSLSSDSEEGTVGLAIWILPGGGFAVGRFSGHRRTAERELPVVFTEMDGWFDISDTPRRISWGGSERMSRESNGLGRAFRSFFSFFGRIGRNLAA